MTKKILYILLITLVALTAVTVSAQENIKDIFKQANDYYKNSKYDKAIESYNKLINKGYADGVLYFNLGNAYEKAGQTGMAIAMYELAKNYIPRDNDLNYNLKLIKPELKNVSKPFILFRPFIAIYNSFSVNELLLITEVLYILVMIVSISFILTRRQNMKSFLKPILTTLLVLFIFFGIMLGTCIYDKKFNRYCVVIEPKVVVFSGPGEQYQIQYEVPEGTKLILQDFQKNDWYKVKLPSGDSGYVSNKSVYKI